MRLDGLNIFCLKAQPTSTSGSNNKLNIKFLLSEVGILVRGAHHGNLVTGNHIASQHILSIQPVNLIINVAS